MVVYMTYSLLSSLLGLIVNIFFDSVIMVNSQNIHDSMQHTILNLRQAWFEKNFSIDINFLMSSDMRSIDQAINSDI